LPAVSDPVLGFQLMRRLPVLAAGGSPGADAVYLLLEKGLL